MSDSNYYQERRDSMLRWYDRFAKRAKPVLVEYYGGEVAVGVLADGREEFDRLLPELPYIGGPANAFSAVMVVNGWLLAIHRALQQRGFTAEDTARSLIEVSDRFFHSIPGVLLKFFGWMAFQSPGRRYFRAQAARSQQRRYSADFVYTIEEEDGELEFRFTECAVNKFYDSQDVPELKPYCNFFDVTYSRLMGMGVDAHQTIGTGCDTCRLRYKHGRATEVPANLGNVKPANW